MEQKLIIFFTTKEDYKKGRRIEDYNKTRKQIA
jgi:hypothetical protein